MGSGLESAITYLLGWGQGPALVILALAAGLEYVFPPFPGDTVTLAGALLAAFGNWPVIPVLASLTLGSLVGAWVDLLIGRGAAARLEKSPRGRKIGSSKGMERVLQGFRRFGPAFIIVNRFLPGIRGLFFVAAGMAGLGTASVLFYAGISALLWNGALMGLGLVLGKNLPMLEQVLGTWFTGIWIILGSIGLIGLFVLIRRRRSSVVKHGPALEGDRTEHIDCD